MAFIGHNSVHPLVQCMWRSAYTINDIENSSSLSSSSSYIQFCGLSVVCLRSIIINVQIYIRIYLLHCLEVIVRVFIFAAATKRQAQRKQTKVEHAGFTSVRCLLRCIVAIGIYGRTEEEQIMYLFALNVNSQKRRHIVMCINSCCLLTLCAAVVVFVSVDDVVTGLALTT